MTLSLKAGATLATLALLTGCAAGPSASPTAMEAAAASTITADCSRGSLDAQRVFILCANGAGTALDAMQALNRPADPTLDIADIAADYGVAPQAMTGIEAATYARIVGRVPESPARNTAQGAPLVTINGRDFRKVTLNAAGRAPATLYIET